MRLDVFLSRRDGSLSRSQAQRFIAAGAVRVNGGAVTKASARVRGGDCLQLDKPAPAPPTLLPEDIPLTFLYEDDHLAVVDKPAGMVVHPAPGHLRGTLVHAALFQCRNLSGIGGVLRPGIVHRLDKDTSGLIVLAKSDAAHRGLADQFKAHTVGKRYLALVCGEPAAAEGSCERPVGRHPTERKKMSTRSRRGKEAVTHWRLRERFGVASLLDVSIRTGRTHQIRVHLAALGTPVVGDRVYGQPGRVAAVSDAAARARLRALNRQALHAAELSFTHPVTGHPLRFLSPLPPDLADLCAYLRTR